MDDDSDFDDLDAIDRSVDSLPDWFIEGKLQMVKAAVDVDFCLLDLAYRYGWYINLH